MSDVKHIEICDKETHEKLERQLWDYTPCPTCKAIPIWDSMTIGPGDEWSILEGWELPESAKIEWRTDGSPREDLISYRDKILSDCLKFTTVPPKFIGTDPAAGRDWSSSNIIDSVKRIREMIPKPIKPDYGKIIVNQLLCMKTFIRFRRNHRKARINKKWHKKYGVITRCVANPVEMLNGTIIMCPCRERELKEAIKSSTQTTVGHK